jgi:hypothetical protein
LGGRNASTYDLANDAFYLKYLAARLGIKSDCHFRNTVTECDRRPGIKRLGCTAK